LWKGTIIRVFDVTDGSVKYQFRRGTYPTLIHCLAFNHKGDLLGVTSDSDTAHIFKLDGSTEIQETTDTSSGKKHRSR